MLYLARPERTSSQEKPILMKLNAQTLSRTRPVTNPFSSQSSLRIRSSWTFEGKDIRLSIRFILQHFFRLEEIQKTPEYRAFIDRTSRIFAERSSGTVTVLLGEEAPCTTWTRVEFPALKSNDQVEEVVSVDPRDTSSRNVIYNKGQPTKRQGLPPWDGGECLDFDDPSWLTQ